MPDRVGQQFGNYRLLRLLGRGGFAEVYLGQHIRLSHAQAAIKILYAQVTGEGEEGFQREANTISSLMHPHIVRILDFDVTDGVPFIVMDYAPNGSLRQRYPRGTQVQLSNVVSYVQQVASALQFAHDHKLIHRDVKPENMLIGRQGDILLSDFGIATIAHNTTSMSVQMAVGTIPYMAPEQIQEHPRPASDQYALGVAAYTWLGGEYPFNGSPTEIVVKHLNVPPPPLRAKVPTIPPEVEQVIFTALAKDPRQRFSTVRAFATALEQASQPAQASSSPDAATIVAPRQPAQVIASALPDTGAITPANQPSSPRTVAIPDEAYSPGIVPAAILRQTFTPPAELRKPRVSPRRITRRRVLIAGLGAAGATAVGGGIFWYEATRKPWFTPTGTRLYTYHGHTSPVYSVAWLPDDACIASGSNDNTVQVWNASDGSHVYTYQGHSSLVHSVAWSPDGTRIASGSSDKSVQVWNASDGSHVYTYHGHTDNVNSVAWSPDGTRIASGSSDKSVQVWNASDGVHAYTYHGHTDIVFSVAWSSDGTRIASGSGDTTVQVWNASDGIHVYTYHGHTDIVFSVAWSPDGTRIASGSEDNTVQVWEA